MTDRPIASFDFDEAAPARWMPTRLGGVIAVLLIGATLGLGLTALAVRSVFPFGIVTIGPWRANPKIGTPSIDPYARAAITRSGALPLGAAEGIAFVAIHDSQGRPLDGRCDYSIVGRTPAARFWTVTLTDPEGRLIANPLERLGFTSYEIVRSIDGFELIVSPTAHAGNWLPAPGPGAFRIVMRFYDTPVGTGISAKDTPMPIIRAVKCP